MLLFAYIVGITGILLGLALVLYSIFAPIDSQKDKATHRGLSVMGALMLVSYVILLIDYWSQQ